MTKVEPSLYLSGLLASQEHDIRATYESVGFSHVETRAQDEWILVQFTKA